MISRSACRPGLSALKGRGPPSDDLCQSVDDGVPLKRRFSAQHGVENRPSRVHVDGFSDIAASAGRSGDI